MPLANYKGSAKLTYASDEQEIIFEGDFEAKQLGTGRIEIGIFVPTPPSIEGEQYIPFVPVTNFTLSFNGCDTDGWRLTTSRGILSAPPPWRLGTGPNEWIIHPRYVTARFKDTSGSGYDRAQFLMSTLLWHERANKEPEPIELEVRGFQMLVKPVDDYLTVAARIMNGGGVEPTASALVRSVDGKKVSLQCYADFMDDLIYVFRLATGAGVEWYYGEALEAGSEAPKERVHKYANHGPFSSAIRTLVPNPDFSGLVEAFLGDKERNLDWDVAKGLINAYVNACNDELSLEHRGLLASTLIDLLVAQYEDKKGIGDFIPEDDFGAVYSTLKDAINKTDLCKEWKQQVTNHLKGAYRRSFRQRLKLLVEDLELPLNSERRNRIVEIRNDLAHRVTYPSEYKNWYNDYMLVIWMDFVSLCCLMGYRGELPDLHQDWRLES